MLKGMCSRRRIIISASLRCLSSPSTTSPRHTSFSWRKKLNADIHTTVALVSCMSSSRLRHWRGCVSQASSSQALGAHLLLQQQVLGARPPPEERISSSYLSCLIIITQWCSNQVGNFVHSPFSIKKATSAHALFNLSSNFKHWLFHHSSLVRNVQ
jgi:hypothetical protein